MAHFHDNALVGASGQGGYQISRSLRFNSADSAYLNRTPASAGNRTTWTWSGWVKRSALTTGGSAGVMSLFGWQSGGSGQSGAIGYDASTDRLYFLQVASTYRITNAAFRDVGAWAHLLFVWDSNNATDAQRCRIYVNGSEASYSSAPSISSGTQLDVNTTIAHGIGADIVTGGGARDFFSGYLTEINFIDGQALTPSSFGETNTITGVWKPKKYAGTYGTNGFYLNFSDNSGTTSTTLGKDSSGNGNNWTPNNFSVTAGAGNDSLIDTPTPYADGGNGRGNYCTWNPLSSNIFGSNFDGNLKFDVPNVRSCLGNFAMSSGKWYCEISMGQVGAAVGVAAATLSYTAAGSNDAFGTSSGWGYVSTGNKRTNSSDSAYGASWVANDIIGVAYDADAGSLTFYKNGVSQGAAFTGITVPVVFAAYGGSGTTTGTFATLNAGQRPFAYTPPSGFVALNTQNLPEPSIKKPSAYMDVKLYSGTNASQSITGLGFSPDLIWFKNRTGTAYHGLFDSVRGRAAGLSSNVTDAESTSSAGNDLVSFDANGFTLGPVQNWNSTNGSGNSIVAWCWDESATPGFDIVTYTGNASNAARSVAHSLGVAPKLMITKGREAQVTGTDNWLVWHGSFGAGDFLSLNTTSAKSTSSSYWGNTVPTSSNFYVGGTSSNVHNESSKNYVAYLWSEVAGFSKFGSYTGNGSSDGPFVFCGFRPRWVLAKRSDASAYNWFIFDAARSPENVSDEWLLPNGSNAEQAQVVADMVSNGFKIRSSLNEFNINGGTYIFAAFAEAPFKYSLAR